ncbi:MAG: hypothetical protein JSU93_07340 [Methanobacteriota archaeon]|nr:MAG: hypothetical protein JSU93_07340 [Euryarchaeota archaeon]
MGLNMAITELESAKSLCRDKKRTMAKAYVSDPDKWADLVEVDRVADLSRARSKLGKEKVDDILKRSRVKVEGDNLYMEKIKDPADQKTLEPFVSEIKTNWIVMTNVPKQRRDEVLKAAVAEDSITEWDLLEFDEMYETCAKCGLSWDNKKGCVGNFGPSTSPVPELARKFKLNLLSKVDDLASYKKVLSSKDAETLLNEIAILRKRTPEEGKMMVRRIDGTLKRLEAMANCSKEYGVGFYFF